MAKTGRPPKEIDYKLLRESCKLQCTGEECAALQGMNYCTLNNHLKDEKDMSFPEYFELHRAEGLKSLRRRQYDKAIKDGNSRMLIWLGKQYLRQTDRAKVEQTVEEKTPTKIEFIEAKDEG
jgi:hypothetical protein